MDISKNNWVKFLENIRLGKSKFSSANAAGIPTERIKEEIESKIDKKLEYIHALENSMDYIRDIIFEERNNKFFNINSCKITLNSIQKEMDEMILSYDIDCDKYELIQTYIERLRYHTVAGKIDPFKAQQIMSMLKDYTNIMTVEELKTKLENVIQDMDQEKYAKVPIID